MKSNIVFGFLGSKLDAGASKNKNLGWRPSVAVVLQKEFPVSRFVIFHQTSETVLMEKVCSDIRTLSPQTEVLPTLMNLKNPWDFEEVYAKLYDFFSKYQFNPEEHEYFAHMSVGTHVAQICLFLLTESRHLPGKLLQMRPPDRQESDQIAGTFKIIDLDLSQYSQLATRFSRERTHGTSLLKSGIATKNNAFNALIDEIEHVVTSRSSPILRRRSLKEEPQKSGPPPVLLIGATGVGKSQLARQIFELRKQRQLLTGGFIEVNCATLRGSHSMSALFGHTKGAYTGASEARAGYLRTADAGMLFLDEIGELGLDEQAMLLRAIEEKRFQPVGSDKDVVSNFQLIAGTNRDLDVEVQQGKFREDLLARINLWTFRLPSLVERREDIEPNIDYELQKFAEDNNQKIGFHRDARKQFLDFAMSPNAVWKSNFRDLNAAIVRMATLSPGGRITIEIVEKEIDRLEKQWQKTVRSAEKDDSELLERYLNDNQIEQIDLFDRVQLAEVIRVCQHSMTISDASRKLFQFSRTQKNSKNDASRLTKYLTQFGLNWKSIKECDG